MARKKRSQKSASKSTAEKKRQSDEKSVDNTNDEEDSTSQNNVEDTTVSHSPKTERSSTPIIHKKFGKVICPDEHDSSNSHTTDSQMEDNVDPDIKLYDQQDELAYENQIICEEVEVLTSDDVQMTNEGATDSESLNQVFEIDERLKQVSVSSNQPNTSVPQLISTSRSNSVDGLHSEGISPSDSNEFEGSNVQCSAADKLLSHRSRSGSTDTTSSESGSASSSSVRRSSRIKYTVQQRHREVVDSPVNNGGTSCSSGKSLLLAPPSPTSSDVDKPVKVKSRWRRTSELEMVVAPRRHSLYADSSQPNSPHLSPAGNPLSPCDTSNSSLGKPCSAVEEKLKTFERIDFNIYKTVRYTNKRAKEKMICDCFLTKEEWARGEMGCGEDCLNRLLMIECCSRCNLKDRCSNKRFQNLEYAKCEMFKTELKGFGLRALEDIPADTFLFEYVGEVVDTQEFHRRALGYSEDHNRHYYFMSLRPDAIIDATIKGNISRFINHSCDPNSETQKWTVDGELRIGFFSRKSIKRGEELTFDYQYQRYGKEAQKCYCGAKNCRGWIGENPDDEVSDEEDDEEEDEDEEEIEEERDEGIALVESSKPSVQEGKDEDSQKPVKAEEMMRSKEKKVKKKKRDVDYVVDDPEKDLITLSSRGIHNKMDTLAVLRCLVLAENAVTRYEVLRLVRSAAAPCRRLLIDYHILKLLYSWMSLKETMTQSETIKHRIEILETLSMLPIPDKTKLKDSNVLQVVTEWSQTRDSEPEELKAVSKEAAKLLDQWTNLVDTFRIPKKERIEQMKEHEREADRGYRENRDSSYARTWDRYRGDIRKEDKYKVDHRKEEDRYKTDHRKDRKSSRESPPDHRSRGPKLTKYEHRQWFAMKVQAEDEERRQQEIEWNMHVERCQGLGLDPTNVSGFDEMTGYPVFINPPPLGTMIPWYPPTPDMSVGGTPLGPSGSGQPPIGFGPDGTPIFAPPPSLFPPPVPPMGLSLPPPLPPMYPGYPMEQPPPPPPPPPLPPPIRLPKFWRTAADSEGRIYYYHCKLRLTQWEPPPYQPPPPPDDSSSSSSGGESSESSEEEEEEEYEDEEYEDEKLIRALNKKTRKGKRSRSSSILQGVSSVTINGDAQVSGIDAGEEGGDMLLAPPPGSEDTAPSSTVPTPALPPPSRKRKREGLVTEYIISPIQEFEKEKARERKRQIKDTKEKLKAARKRKHLEAQQASASLDLNKPAAKKKAVGRSHHHRVKAEVSSSTSKIESAAADSSEPAVAERQLKEQFRLGMAGVIVHYLNPYRKEDCSRGRIVCNEDFKHLARKLTHFVLVKELKHCRNVGDLQCNENVKHKAKDFIRKYMSKFGEVYAREKEID